MTFKKSAKAFIKKFDLFCQQVTFRYNEEPAYESLTGGCMSIILIIAFVGIFATTLLRTFNKEYIDYNQTKFDEESPSYFNTSLENTFMFTVGLQGFDLNASERYFDVYMQFRHYNSTHKIKQNLPMHPCTRDQWERIGFVSAYDKLSLNKWLCPEPKMIIQLQGKFTTDVFKFYKFAVAKCKPSLQPTRPCVSDATIETFLNGNQAFNFNFYFINTILNPGNEVYIKRYLEDINYFPFSKTNGVNANVFVSSYTIKTDQSLLPNQQIRIDEGGIVLETAQMLTYEVRGTEYFKLFLRKSPISIEIQRAFRGIDDTLSYIGGLFSTILVFLGFLNVYNQLAYEMEITKSCYYYDKNDPFDADQFNLLTFFVYMIYSLFHKVGISLPWPKYGRFHRFLQEGKIHMDMRLIMKKILYAQKLGTTILDQNKHKALLLQQPLTLQQAEKTRKDLRFYKNFRKKHFPKGQLVELNAPDNEQSIVLGQSPSIEVLNQSDKQLTNKVYPLPAEQVMRYNNSIALSPRGNRGKKIETITAQIRHQEQLSELDKQMKLYMLQLNTEVQRNDHIARRIFDNIDPRIKKRYLSIERQRKLNRNFILAKSIK